MCVRYWNCGGARDNCLFVREESMSIEAFYIKTRLCKYYRDNKMCGGNKNDGGSFADIAELLWHPRAYMYKTAFELLRLKKLAEKDTDSIHEDLYKLINWDIKDEAPEMIREKIRQTNTTTKVPFDEIIKRARYLWETADRYSWRDKGEWQEIQSLLDDREYCESIDFEAFRADRLRWIEEDGMLKCRKAFSEEESGGFIPASVTVSVEDTSMTDPKRVDVLLHDEDSGKSIALELKQWTETWIKPDDIVGFMVIGRDGSEYVDMHPVIQASFYSMMISTDEGRRARIKKDNPGLKTINDEINKEGVSEERKDELKRKAKEEIDDYTRHIIDNMPNGDPRCIPLVYLHNQYYDHGLLYELANDRASLLNDLYIGCLSKYHIGGKPFLCMYTHNKCYIMLDLIKKWFNE